jgi:hypothetical protein
MPARAAMPKIVNMMEQAKWLERRGDGYVSKKQQDQIREW